MSTVRGPSELGLPTQPSDASPPELRVLGGHTDYSIVHHGKASPQELPTWRIPNVPSSAEAYYAPDNYHCADAGFGRGALPIGKSRWSRVDVKITCLQTTGTSPRVIAPRAVHDLAHGLYNQPRKAADFAT